jgi:GTP-binding protein
MIGTRRLKLFYAAQTRGENDQAVGPVKIVLFVNQPKLLSDPYSRYLERRIRAAWPFAGLPVLFSCRARSESAERPSARPASRRG